MKKSKNALYYASSEYAPVFSQNGSLEKHMYLEASQYYQKSIIPDPKNEYLLKMSHDYFPGTTECRPMSLKRPQNITREMEGCTSTNKRNFIGRSFEAVEDMFKNNQYSAIIDFAIETVREILRAEFAEANISEYTNSDLSVLLDAAAIYGIIDSTDIFRLGQLVSIKEASNLPYERIYSYELTQMPKNYNSTYDYSNQQNIDSNGYSYQPTLNDALQSIKILSSFLRDNTTKHKDIRYEPFLTKMENSPLFKQDNEEEDI